MEGLGVNDERAQVILVGAFLIAIGVLSALLIVNDIGFSQTIATQDGGEDSFESLEVSAGTERAVSEAMTGNGTTPSNASVEFEEYLESYSNGTNEALLSGGASAEVSPDTNNLTTAWMVGQRSNGGFTNANGTERWIMVENVEPSKNENIRGRFKFNVSEMKESAPDTDPFVLNATEDDTFNNLLSTLGGGPGWNLTAKINETSPGGPQFLRLNMTEFDTSLVSPVISKDEESVNVTDKKNVTVDIFNQTVDEDSSGFPDGTSVNPREANGFRFENGSEANGTYEFRFNGSLEKSAFDSSTGGPNGPCDHPDGPPCRSADDTEKHIVGVVHNVTGTVADIEYISRSTSYEDTIGTAGGMTLDAEDVNLDEVENVDGNASFNIEILADNSPVEEDSGNKFEIKYRVENRGTANGTQEILLKIPAADPDPGMITNGSQLDTSSTQEDVFVKARDSRVSTGPTVIDPSGSADDINNVTWEPGPDTNGTYTAFVVSENSTTGEKTVDSTVISVDKSGGDPGIPESPVGFALPFPSWDAVAEAAFAGEVSR